MSDNFQLFVFENRGDNEYELVWQSDKLSFIGDIVIADSDRDEKMEIVVGGKPFIYLFENTGDNAYRMAWSTRCKATQPLFADMNQNGVDELIFTGYAVHVFENCGMDSYIKIWHEKELLVRTVADIDYDGNYELVGVNADGSKVCIWKVSCSCKNSELKH